MLTGYLVYDLMVLISLAALAAMFIAPLLAGSADPREPSRPS